LAGDRVERRLAAVLAADVAGYSRLMGADEEGTLARLKAIRKSLVDPAIASHRGRIVKTTGDGILKRSFVYFVWKNDPDKRLGLDVPFQCAPVDLPDEARKALKALSEELASATIATPP